MALDCLSSVMSFFPSHRHVSAAEGHLDVVKFLLLQPGIDINARDANDFTPLLGGFYDSRY